MADKTGIGWTDATWNEMPGHYKREMEKEAQNEIEQAPKT